MKKILLTLILLMGITTQSQNLRSVVLDSPTTFLYEKGRKFLGDTLFIKGYRIIVNPGAIVRFKHIVGPGEIYIHEGAIFRLTKNLPKDVQVYIVKEGRGGEKNFPEKQKG